MAHHGTAQKTGQHKSCDSTGFCRLPSNWAATAHMTAACQQTCELLRMWIATAARPQVSRPVHVPQHRVPAPFCCLCVLLRLALCSIPVSRLHSLCFLDTCRPSSRGTAPHVSRANSTPVFLAALVHSTCLWLVSCPTGARVCPARGSSSTAGLSCSPTWRLRCWHPHCTTRPRQASCGLLLGGNLGLRDRPSRRLSCCRGTRCCCRCRHCRKAEARAVRQQHDSRWGPLQVHSIRRGLMHTARF